MWTTPEKHTKRRETLGNANQNKSTRRPGYKKVYDNPLPSKEAFRIKRARWNAQQNKNTNNNGWTEEDQTKSPKMNQSNQKGSSPMKTTLRWTEPYKMLKRTTKPLRRRVLIEEGPAKSSKKQHSDNTDQWHLCKAGSFSYGESPRTPPLEGTSLHRWNNSVERPWGILSLFTTCLRCVWNHTATGCNMWTTPKKHTKSREKLGNANQTKNHRKSCTQEGVWKIPKEAFIIKGASWNAGQNKNTNNNS